MRGEKYQIVLIALGLVVAMLFGVFLYREVFPEYKLYQDHYIALEEFRTSYTGESMPPFSRGVKQTVIEDPEKGPPTIDRCMSCHVAVQFEHFSPTKIARDINGDIEVDEQGIPKKVPNDTYVWTKLNEKIAFLKESGNDHEAQKLESLKMVEVGEHTFDVTQALQMHPLMGRETRPFEYHPIEIYGCTSCHNGNGRALTFGKAHGPVFDGDYEEEYMGPEPQFLELDSKNDPQFAHVFNSKPSGELLFQTNPIFVGSLIQAKCMNCHLSSQGILQEATFMTNVAANRRLERSEWVERGYNTELASVESLVELINTLNKDGFKATLDSLNTQSQNMVLSPEKRAALYSQYTKLLRFTDQGKLGALEYLQNQLIQALGSKKLAKEVLTSDTVTQFVKAHLGNKNAVGSLFNKARALDKEKEALLDVGLGESMVDQGISDEKAAQALESEIDFLTRDYHRGKELFISQACYACHRIDGLTKGGVGPELTNAGDSYPWFLKESIVWPQADLKTSTMPNFMLDHNEIEDLVTFLLGQHGKTEAISETEYRTAMSEWEAGKRQMPWEKPVNPANLHNLDDSMTIFATQGCASCHRLKGFESNVGFTIEKSQPDFDTLYKEELWFQETFPESIAGSQLVKAIDKNRQEIDARISSDVREKALLERLETKYPGLIASFYSNFQYALRAKNYHYNELAKQAKTPEERQGVLDQLKNWKGRVQNVMMMYVQQYGLGRLIGPRPNWSGIYRSDQWLMQHFKKPTRHIPRSIMPVLPFDDTKFYALTYMLDMLAIKNRDDVREIWNNKGFDPEKAYDIFCSQCHGDYLHGNGPVSKWIYPIPKNLADANFMRNYTKENVIYSLTHGIKGTPMPPWGEVASDKPMADGIPVLTKEEIKILTDWLFTGLLGGRVIQSSEDVPKWQYGPEDVIEEMFKEKEVIKPGLHPQFFDVEEMEHKEDLSALVPKEEYLVSVQPMPMMLKEQKPKLSVEDVFEVEKNPEPGEPYLYYIKPEYYTDENLKAGQTFFELNCAICHGKDADGQGFRAGTMFDAKPRMLTNLHWIDMRDDLRLLRSLKYGVPGTSMTAWGDQTSALQRLQLVMYIRTLSIEQRQRELLFNTLYDVFDRSSQILSEGRIEEYNQVNQIKKSLVDVNEQRLYLLQKVKRGTAESSEPLNLYKKELLLSGYLKERKEADQILVKLQKELEKEKDIYQKLGVKLIGKTIFSDAFEDYLALINVDNGKYTISNGRVSLVFEESKRKKIETFEDELVHYITNLIQKTEVEHERLLGKLSSKQRNEELTDVKTDLKNLQQLKNDLIAGFNEAVRSRDKQKELYDNYQQKLKELTNDKI